MSNNMECAAYFRSQKGLDRLFLALRKKWQSYGRCAGKVKLGNCTAEERKALERLLGVAFMDPDVVISLAQVEGALQESRFAPMTLRELLEAYFQEPMVTNNHKKQEKQRRREAFLNELVMYFQKDDSAGEVVCRWLDSMYETQKYGYAVLQKEWDRDAASAFILARNVGDAFLWTQRDATQRDAFYEMPIAVLAAQVTGNPHYFDRGSAAGTLLTHCLCFWQGQEFPQSAYGWKRLLKGAGILPDDVASTVITYGIHLVKGGGLHPGMEQFFEMAEPVTVTSLNLMGCDSAFGENGRAYIVENEMVFRYLYERIKNQRITLLCTSGQMRTAAWDLIRLLTEGKTKIYYSGDMDPEGLGIAERLWKQYPGSVHPWRMGPMEYERGLSLESIDPRSLAQLDAIENAVLAETAKCIQSVQRAAYQENMLEALLEDMLYERIC